MRGFSPAVLRDIVDLFKKHGLDVLLALDFPLPIGTTENGEVKSINAIDIQVASIKFKTLVKINEELEAMGLRVYKITSYGTEDEHIDIVITRRGEPE